MMKIRNVLFVLALVAAPAAVEAQACGGDACLTATGSVAAFVNASATQGITLGVIDPTSGATVGLGDATNAGSFTIESNQALWARLAVTPLVHGSDATQQLALTITCGAGASQADAVAAPFGDCTTFNPVLTAPGLVQLFVGASAAAPTNAHLAGIYTGTVTLTTSNTGT